MENKIIKNIIILGSIVFTFAFANMALAYSCYDYSCADYYNQESSRYDYRDNDRYYDSQSSRYVEYSYPRQQLYRSTDTRFTQGYVGYQQPYYYSTDPNAVYAQAYTQQQQAQVQPIVIYANQPATAVTPVVQTEKPIINNYYYQTAPVATTTTPKTTTTTTVINPIPVPKTTTNTTSNTTNYNTTPTLDTNGAYNYNNGLGASAYNYAAYNPANGSEITALSLRGSGSFMPSSIWQWLIVIVLILVIIIIARSFMHKPSPSDHTVHVH